MITRTTLGNGLRVVQERRDGAPRVAVAVHYGVGFRDEEPGFEGFAHLFEHLMFRGSASLPPGAYFDLVVGSGGRAGGTTHPDYTDYHQVVPVAALERALFCEADRMRAPVFTEETVAEQLAGVCEEIRQNTVARPFGDLPWPALPGVLHRRHANAHDGYGARHTLSTASPADCAAFFARHYAPGNAVLTIVGPVPAEQVLALVRRHFDAVPAGPVPARPELHEPAFSGQRLADGTEPGVERAAVAAGWVLPDPATDLDSYVDHLVLARLLDGRDREAGCGWFGPLDARAPDVFVVSGTAPPGTAQEWLRAVDTRCAALADGPPPDELARAVAGAVTDRHRADADLTARARARGRFELLFGRAELLDELPGRTGAVTAAGVAAAAQRIAAGGRGVLVVEPGPERTRPAARPAASRPAPAALGPVARGTAPNGRSGRRGVPAPGPRTIPVPPRSAERRTAGGPRVVAVRDDRAPLVELRARLPLGPAGWTSPERVPALLWLVTTACAAHARAGAVGARFTAHTDGQWLEVTGVAPSGASDEWLAVLADLTAGAGVEPGDPEVAALLDRAGPAAQSLRSPDRVADDVLRRRWLADRPGAACDLRTALGGSGGGCVLAVGDVDPDSWVDRAASRWQRRIGPGSGAPDAGRAAPATVLAPAAGDAVLVTVSAPEEPDPGAEAARYLCTALLGGGRTSRLRGLEDLPGMTGFGGHAGRDTLGPAGRGFLRLAAPGDRLAGALEHVSSVLAATTADPPHGDEVRDAARYCADELATMFDSPAALADGMIRILAADSAATPDTIAEFGTSLLALTGPQVAEVAVERAELLATALMTDVIDLRDEYPDFTQECHRNASARTAGAIPALPSRNGREDG